MAPPPPASSPSARRYSGDAASPTSEPSLLHGPSTVADTGCVTVPVKTERVAPSLSVPVSNSLSSLAVADISSKISSLALRNSSSSPPPLPISPSSAASTGPGAAMASTSPPSSSPTVFVPPTRPSSTPFGYPENRLGRELLTSIKSQDVQCSAALDTPSPSAPRSAISLEQLPVEIHEAILDHLFGFRFLALAAASRSPSAVNLTNVMRHPRRRELSDLALVCRSWRFLIQQRIYRHIILKGTDLELEVASEFLTQHPHLPPYIRQIELWFPLYHTLPTDPRPAAFERVFGFMARVIPEALILVMEGGGRRKVNKVDTFSEPLAETEPETRSLPVLPSVRMLVTKGQWNLLRSAQDFAVMTAALPNLTEWHGSYTLAKGKAYTTAAEMLDGLPARLTEMNLSLENDFRREHSIPDFYIKSLQTKHLCSALGRAAPMLERITYSGRICPHLFRAIYSRTALPPEHRPQPRLRSFSATIRNCCRTELMDFSSADADNGVGMAATGSGIHEPGFVASFEQLVLSAIRAFGSVPTWEYLRIRFLDLESHVNSINPFFLISDGWCSGVWSPAILDQLARYCPEIQYEGVWDSFAEVDEDGQLAARKPRWLTLKLDNYSLYNAQGDPVSP